MNVHFLNKNGNKIETAQPDFSGECFLFSDTTGNTFLSHIKKNRFSNIARNLRVNFLQFLDHNFQIFALASKDKDVFIYNSSGKKLEVLKGHRHNVFKVEVNYVKEIFFTASRDRVILWNLKTFKKIRTLLPKREGNRTTGRKLRFTHIQFTSDSDFLLTRFDV